MKSKKIIENISLLIFYCHWQKDKLQEILARNIIPQVVEIKTIALACLAKMEVIQLLKSLESGVDAVAIWGCADEDCLYIPGSRIARGRVKYAQKILEHIGLEKVRFQYFHDQESNFKKKEIEFCNWLKQILPENHFNSF